MAAREGFLLIDLMLAVFLFMGLVYAVVRIQATIVLMHNEIDARTDMIGAFARAIDWKGAGAEHVPYRRATDKTLPLHRITITKKRTRTCCSLETVGWIYE